MVANLPLGLCALFISCILSSMGGIGGGGLNVTILLVVMEFGYTQAVTLSLCTVLGNSMAQVSVNLLKPHPDDRQRSLIYWDAVIILLPALLGGSTLAVVFEKALPDSLMIILAIVILVLASSKTLIKGIHTYQSENAEMLVPAERSRLSSIFGSVDRPSEAYLAEFELAEDAVRISSFAIVSKQIHTIKYPKLILSVIICLWLILATIAIIMELVISKCSSGYYIMLAANYPFLLGTVIWGLKHVARNQIENPSSVLKGDLDFKSASLLPSFLSFLVGAICALIGIGGGELMGPLLLSMHILPQVSSATTSLMSMFTTAANVLHYGVMGSIPTKWAGIVYIIGFIGGFSGRQLALYIAHKFHRSSVTIFMLVVVLLISIGLLIEHLTTSSISFAFSSIC